MIYHKIEKTMNIKGYLKTSLENIMSSAHKFALSKLVNSMDNDSSIEKSLELIINLIDTTDYSNVDTGWNSLNPNIFTKCGSIKGDIHELLRVKNIFNKKSDNSITSKFITEAGSSVNICSYFNSKGTVNLNIDLDLKQISTITKELIIKYKEIQNSENGINTYPYLILNKILLELQKTLICFVKLK